MTTSCDYSHTRRREKPTPVSARGSGAGVFEDLVVQGARGGLRSRACGLFFEVPVVSDRKKGTVSQMCIAVTA